jgi:hypothetical protein
LLEGRWGKPGGPSYCKEAYGELGLPLNIMDNLSIVVIEGSGGFQVDHLISLDVEHLANDIILLANTLHELAHIWIGSILKPERPEDLWFSEALSDLLMVRALQTLGYSEAAPRIVSRTLHRARKARRSLLYRPPTRIHVPLIPGKADTARSIGTALLYEIAR